MLLLWTTLFLAQTGLDWSRFETLDSGRSSVLSFSRNGERTVIGRETNCQVSWSPGAPFENVGLEDHWVTGILALDNEIWAGTASVYNLTIPVILKAHWDELPLWESMGTLPDGAGNIIDIFLFKDTLFFKTPLHLFKEEDGLFLEVMPPNGAFFDVDSDENTIMILARNKNGTALVYRADESLNWELQNMDPVTDPIALKIIHDRVWLATEDGLIREITNGFSLQSQIGEVADLMGTEGFLLISHSQGRLTAFNSENQETLILPDAYEVMAAPRLFMDEDNRFYMSCIANQKFVPVSCAGLLEWLPLGKLDLNGDGILSDLDEQWLRLHWLEDSIDWDGDGHIGPFEWAAVLSLIPSN